MDLLIARHSLQFSDPSTVLRFFDLAAAALKKGGRATAINFTPFTEYMFQYDNGWTQRRIEKLNETYARGVSDAPGGYLHPTRGELKLSLATLMGRPELSRGDDDRFLYFDANTVVRPFRDWTASRRKRGLNSPLVLGDQTYFSPPSIAKVNKLVSNPDRANRENFAFTLHKVTD